MAIKTISRRKLTSVIRQLYENELSGVVMVQTDARRAIVLRFAAGKLVRVNARGNSVDDAIEILRQSDEYRCSFNAMSVNDGPELISIAELVERLGSNSAATAVESGSAELLQAPASAAGVDKKDFDRDFLQGLLVRLAAEEIGPMASMLVEQALEDGTSTEQVIALVAEHIPDDEAANRFRHRAIEESKRDLQ